MAIRMGYGIGKRILSHIIGEERVAAAMPLYSGKTREEVRGVLASEMVRRMGLAVAVGVFLSLVFFLLPTKEAEGNERLLQRPAAGGTTLQVPFFIETEEGLFAGKLLLGAHQYTEAEVEELHGRATEWLETNMLGANTDFFHVTKALYLPEELSELTAALSWYSDHPQLVSALGEVKNEELSGPVDVTVEAKIFYGEEYRIFTKQITVLPKDYSAAELAYREGLSSLQAKEEAERTSESFLLPETVLGMRLLLPEKNTVPLPLVCALLFVVLLVVSYYGYFNDMEAKKKKRAKQAKEAYQEFMTRLSLLMAAGLSARHTWKRLTEEYARRYGSGHVLARELFVTETELENGRSELLAYEAFGERLGLVSYERLASLLVQHVTRGVQGMQQQLLNEAREVLAQEREQIKVRGEEMGTKLLLPTMGLLVLVFAVLLVPAFLSFS